MAFDIPDDGEGLSRIQSIVFQEDLEVAISDPPMGTYAKSGGVVTAQGVPNLTVAVSAGVVYSQGYRFPFVANASLAIAVADITNPRLDAVVVTTAGVLAVRTGTPVAFTTTTTPKPAALTLGDVMLAQVYVPALATAIATANIKDRRLHYPNLDMFKTEFSLWDNALHAVPTSGTASLSGRGGTLTGGGTVSHPTITAGRVNQVYKTRYANLATTVNQILGVYQNGAGLKTFWRGNAANQGGFYFRGKMAIDLYPAATIRYFMGMSSGTVGVSISDTLAGDICGIWHDATMAATVLNFITRDNVTTTTTAITLGAALAAGQGFELIMYCKPNDTILYYKVMDMLTGNTLADSFATATLPRNTIFLGPEANMSNAANTTVTTTAPGVVEVFVGQPAIRT